ncbi:MAG: SDR family NAD(P)-dependent oxidoreductase [Gammaproteobacteria bacterium]|nr:SDR family NAD(P)-dependent oxidoreductase [Gammaproteobacteria bacterium]
MSNTGAPQIALVTGANRGIGREVALGLARDGLHVIAAARDPGKLNDLLEQARDESLDIEARKLDITSGEQVRALADWLKSTHKGLDVLVNSAGILPESSDDTTGRYSSNPWLIPATSLMEIFNTNTLGAVRLIQALGPLLRPNARVVNVSSGMGQLSDMDSRVLGYRLSKTALNTVTRVFANELAKQNIKVNSVCPGWVQTDMGGPNASRTPAEGAASVLWAARLGPDGPSGGFYRDGKEIPW